MADDDSIYRYSVYASGAEGPLALPWREQSGYAISLPAQPLYVKGARVTLACPTLCGSLIIDGPSVTYRRGGKQLSLKTEDLLGAKVKGEGVCDGKQQTSVVLCYHETSTPRDDNEAEALLPASYGELVLYELPKKPISTPGWPLAFQEFVVHQINSHIESIRGVGGLCNTVSVENDTYVDNQGFNSLVSRAVDDQDGDKGQENQSSSPRFDTKAVQAEGSDTQLHNTMAVSRAWQRTPALPLAASRLSFETQGNELVVTCRPSKFPVWWTFAFWIFLFVIIVVPSNKNPTTMPLPIVTTTAMLLGRHGADQQHWNCDDLSPAISTMCIVVLLLLVVIRAIVDRVYKQPTLRVSPAGWSLKFWPDPVNESFILKRFLSVTGQEMSTSTAVHGAKVLCNAYPRRRRFGRHRISPVLHTAAGTVPLDMLLGPKIYMPDARYTQQDYETLVATINRHLSTVREAPVATQNDVHPSVFTEISARGQFPITPEEHDALLTQQHDSVRAVNFNRGGVWVSTESLDASTARSTIATVSPMHASLVVPSPEPTEGTSQVQFICTDLTSYIAAYFVLELVGLFFVLLDVLIFLLIFACLPSAQAEKYSCMVLIMLQPVTFFVIVPSYWFVIAMVCHMRRVVTIEVSPSGRFWKLQRSFGCPPFGLFGFGALSFIPLQHYVMRWTRTVAEGSTDDLWGCEVRVKQVKHWFTKGGLQRASLFLHHHPSGAAKPKELRLAGWAAFELTNISEKLIIAQAINSALATVDSGFDMAENC